MFQVSRTCLTYPFADRVTEARDINDSAGLVPRRMRVTGRPTFRRASTNPINASPSSLNAEYESSFSSGNNSKGDSPSSNCREQESSPTKLLLMPTRRTFTLLNDPRISRHRLRKMRQNLREWCHIKYLSD